MHVAVLALLYLGFHPTHATWPTGPLLATVFLVQAWDAIGIYAVGINAVSWSLSCEAFFYAVWPLIIRPFSAMNKKLSWLIVLVLYGVLLTATWNRDDFPANKQLFTYVFPPLRLVEFLAGVLLASAMQSGWRCRVPLPVGFLLLFAEVCALRSHVWHIDQFPGLLLDPLLLMIIAIAAGLDMEGRPGWLKSRVLIYMGKVSFAFYLVHISVLEYLQIHLPKISLEDNLRGTVLLFVCSAAVAMFLHHVVELPFNRLLRPRHDKPLSV